MRCITSDFLIVGAGYAGCVTAEQLAQAGFTVTLIDKREHIGGNAYDETDEQGVLIHRYGPHIFHTNSERIFNYLSQFTEWRNYEHRVLASVDGQVLPIPINQTTINKLYGLNLDEEGVKQYLNKVREECELIKTSEDVVLNSVGRDLYEKFFKGYTQKQWGLDPSELAASVTARIPVRTNTDDRYFTDPYQAMPLHGYTTMFEHMLEHENITVGLNTDFNDIKESCSVKHTIYTGPIDTYFDYRYGALPYRSLKFEHLHLPDTPRYQSVGTVNYPNDHAYTRITEFKHLTGQQHSGTSIVREYPQAEGDPYYPIPRTQNETIYQQYKLLADQQTDVTFVGRLAQYRYYNMDQVVGTALSVSEKLRERFS